MLQRATRIFSPIAGATSRRWFTTDTAVVTQPLNKNESPQSHINFHKMESSNARLRRIKRYWTEEEDQALIEVMKDLCSSGKYKNDNRFRRGFFLAVEEALNTKLPGCNLKARPHINSRANQFRNVFNIMHDMVVRKATSGFRWDSTNNCVMTSREVWKDYLKGHPETRHFKVASSLYYEDLCIIFGDDRANGKGATDHEDLEKEVTEEEVYEDEANDPNNGRDGATELSPTPVRATNSTTGSQNKKEKIRDKWVNGVIEAALILGKDIKAASIELSRAVSHDLVLSEKRLKINGELMKLERLTTLERHQAGRMIALNHETIDIFFSITDNEKEEWVFCLLRGDI